ncbi:hypothetical protein [Paenibacillus dendritiformis]|uniref:hypothetical protein n=1 Tax=Paenibacillus dendritiformis TaxID=130049 RepID=UPI00387E1318
MKKQLIAAIVAGAAVLGTSLVPAADAAAKTAQTTPASQPAVITLDQKNSFMISGVHMGMSKGKAEKVLGKPKKLVRLDEEEGYFDLEARYGNFTIYYLEQSVQSMDGFISASNLKKFLNTYEGPVYTVEDNHFALPDGKKTILFVRIEEKNCAINVLLHDGNFDMAVESGWYPEASKQDVLTALAAKADAKAKT